MPLFSLAFLCGIIILQTFSSLPEKKWIAITILLALFLLKQRRSSRQTHSMLLDDGKLLCVACLIGFAWALFYAHMQFSWTLPTSWEGKTVKVIGTIVSIPHVAEHRNNFLFDLDTIQYNQTSQSARGLIRISWQNDQIQLHAGEKWMLPVRLKKIHGTLNPGGFDQEAWSMQQGIRAHGYVVVKEKYEKLSDTRFSMNRVRQYFYQKINENLPISQTSPWITALAIGERQGIAAENWQVLRNTGTNHLMAIAGLHIGFLSLFVYTMMGWVWRRMPRLILILPVQHAAGIAALVMAVIYSAMAGFSIPTQRACLMFAVLIMIVLMRRRIIAWHAWSLALMGVLLLNPLSVLTESFWLSFGSVALIIYGMKGRLAPSGIWWKWGRIQWVIAVGLIPLSIWLFQQCSLISFVANSIAIPCVGFLIVPLTLLGCLLLLISAKLGGLVLLLADKILQLLWMTLTYLSQLSWASWYQYIPDMWILITACIGMIILLLPIGFSGRWLGVVWLLPLVLYQAPLPKLNDIWFTLLDVGQGLSAVVQTKNHVLVFDTGAKLSENYDMGESVILPFLRTIGAKKLDMLVVSHGDNDHSGGAGAIIKQIPIKQIKTSELEIFSVKNVSHCLKGQSWAWDNVYFQFLYPVYEQLGLGNDSSCVLKISNGKNSILLTGDIEKIAEKYLVASGGNLSADILVAPHHGSKTSALDEFIQTVRPQIVLYPVGYRNQYHFPHPSVIKKYQQAGVVAYDTVKSGAIQFKLDESIIKPPFFYRTRYRRYWHDSN